MTASLLAVILCVSVPAICRIPKANVTVTPRETALNIIHSEEFGGGQGWQTDFIIANESDVPFIPESIVAYFYEGDRLDDKIKLNYEEILGYMDTDKLRCQDTPISIRFGTNHMYLTHIKVAVFGRDVNGHEMQIVSQDVMLMK